MKSILFVVMFTFFGHSLVSAQSVTDVSSTSLTLAQNVDRTVADLVGWVSLTDSAEFEFCRSINVWKRRQ
mgnify:CR=1 FL=1